MFISSRRFVAPLLTVAVFFCLLSGPAVAQDETPDVRQDVNDTRITLDVKGAPLLDLIAHIRERARVNIILAKDVDRQTKVDATFSQVPWQEALKVIVERGECVLIQKAANLYAGKGYDVYTQRRMFALYARYWQARGDKRKAQVWNAKAAGKG